MKLIKCHIENFGKLSDFTYDFTDGCNTVCEENGWGKSTLAAFLRVMLFGFRNEGKRDPLEMRGRDTVPGKRASTAENCNLKVKESNILSAEPSEVKAQKMNFS